MSPERPSLDDTPSRIGRAMLFGAWIVGLALLVRFFQRWLFAGHGLSQAVRNDSTGRHLGLQGVRQR